MNKEMKMVVNTIINEMGRMEERINKRFERMEYRLDSMQHEINSMQHEVNACKLERDEINMLLKKVDQHEERIKALEKRTA